MDFRATDIAHLGKYQTRGHDRLFTGASTDSRRIQPGQLYVPIVGARDGHDFIADAIARGAAGFLTQRSDDASHENAVAIEVDNTLLALRQLGTWCRQQMTATAIGITGSNGKTSTKDMLASILRLQAVTTANEASFNNEIGAPLTIINADPRSAYLLLEMGARRRGNITELTGMAKPSVGAVTNVGFSHIGEFGSIEAVAATKAELVESLPSDGTAVLNADDTRVALMHSKTTANVLFFGLKQAADVTADSIALDDFLRPTFRLHTPDGQTHVKLKVSGLHQVSNATCAAAIALSCDIPLDRIAQGLSEAHLSPHRMAFVRSSNGMSVINDAYNASPASMRAALDSLAQIHATTRIAILGEMAELGDISEREHAAIATYAHQLGVKIVPYRTELYGISPIETHDEVVALVRSASPDASETAVLVKASRIFALETLVEEIIQNA